MDYIAPNCLAYSDDGDLLEFLSLARGATASSTPERHEYPARAGHPREARQHGRSRREWNDGSADEYADRTSSVPDGLQTLKPFQKKVFGGWKTLDRLVADGILRLGLAPRCPHCTQETGTALMMSRMRFPARAFSKPSPFRRETRTGNCSNTV